MTKVIGKQFALATQMLSTQQDDYSNSTVAHELTLVVVRLFLLETIIQAVYTR
jgi:hypothetical protein